MLKPKYYNWTDMHAVVKLPRPEHGRIHFDTSEARFDEWIGLYKSHKGKIMPAQDFLVSHQNETSTHILKNCFKGNANGTWTMMFDETLLPWLQFVAKQII